MRDLAWIIEANAAAAGREAAEAENAGDRALARKIFNANRSAEGDQLLAAPGVHESMGRVAYRAFLHAFVKERTLPPLKKGR